MGWWPERHREGFLLGHPWNAGASYYFLEIKGWACNSVSSLPASETVADLSSWTPKEAACEVVFEGQATCCFSVNVEM